MNKNLRILWLALAAVLGLFIGGRWNIPLAAWIGPIFAIRFFRDSEKAGRNFMLLWLASAIPTIISWNGATFFSNFHPLAEAGFFLLMTPLGLIPYVIDRMYYQRFGSAAWVSLVYPIAATGMDFFSSNGSPFGTFGAAAYSQRDFLPVMQIAAVTGLWGITFVMTWFASLVNQVWENGFKLNRLAWTFAGVLALILGLGLGRTLLAPSPETRVTIAGFSLPNGKMSSMMKELGDGNEDEFRSQVDELHVAQLEQMRALAQDGAQIIVLQEGAGIGFSDQVEKLLADTAEIARTQNVYIVLPTFDLGKRPAENVVQIIDPNGDVVLTHVKYGGNDFEGTLKGDGVLQTVDTPYGKLSAVICWDADFPNVIKQAGALGVDLLFIPSQDWLGVRDVHAGMATFRAVENGTSIFRQTGQGVSVVADAFGNQFNRVDSFEENTTGEFAAIQVVNTPVGSTKTQYPFIGDIVGNVMLCGLIGLAIGLLLTRKKQSQH